ncbi:MAG TPA: hypothetical protein VNB94_05250 [Mycobacteriales bacterium]|nr:hypothetical protein [Mycobacteriales bacterium]
MPSPGRGSGRPHRQRIELSDTVDSEPDGMDEAELFADLSRRLREAHRMVAALTCDEDTKSSVVRRLIAVTDASKHDLRRASERLDALLADLEAQQTG